MNRVTLGLICGLVFAVVTVAVMMPMTWDLPVQKNDAMLAAFFNRFMIGFLIPLVSMGINRIAMGALIGFALSLPPAIISHLYAPILIVGTVGGAIIGWISGRFSR